MKLAVVSACCRFCKELNSGARAVNVALVFASLERRGVETSQARHVYVFGRSATAQSKVTVAITIVRHSTLPRLAVARRSFFLLQLGAGAGGRLRCGLFQLLLQLVVGGGCGAAGAGPATAALSGETETLNKDQHLLPG